MCEKNSYNHTVLLAFRCLKIEFRVDFFGEHGSFVAALSQTLFCVVLFRVIQKINSNIHQVSKDTTINVIHIALINLPHLNELIQNKLNRNYSSKKFHSLIHVFLSPTSYQHRKKRFFVMKRTHETSSIGKKKKILLINIHSTDYIDCVFVGKHFIATTNK